MAAVTRRQYKGAAASTTTTNSLTSVDTSVTLTATTGWPSTAAVPFYVVIDPGTSSEEKCSATISGSTLTLTRGQDDTTAVSHTSGATIYPVFSADDADEANAFASTMTTRGDLLTMASGPTVGRIAIGASGTVIYSNGTDPAWASLSTAGIAPVASPTFTGTPAAPTAANGTSTTQLATTAFVYANGSQQTVSTKTASYTLVAADRNTRVVMNSASATTITVNTSVFAAGDTLTLLNIGAGVCTVTAGTCTVGTTGSLALAQNGGGTLTFISASASVFTASAVAASTSGLTLISSTSLASGTTSVNNCFSATYMNYMLVLSDANASAQSGLTFRFRVSGVDSSTGYYAVALDSTYASGAYSSRTANNGTAVVMPFAQIQSTARSGGTIFIQQPFSAATTSYQFLGADHETARGPQNGSGFHNVATSYDGFSLILATGTFSNGTIKVYGLANT